MSDTSTANCLPARLGWLACLMGAALALVFSAPIAAASIVDQAAQQAEQVQRDQAEQARRQQLEDRLERDQAPVGELPQAPTPEGSDPASTCIQIDRITIEGITLLSQPSVSALTHPYYGKCLGLAELNDILKQVTFLYVESGFITSRAYLPEQDLSDGNLQIVVVEGSLRGIIMDGEPASYHSQIATAFPGLVGKPVNLRDTEQGLDQINRLKSRAATTELSPGEELGDTTLLVAVERTKPWSITLGANNLGGQSTGEYQSKIDISFDDLLGLNEQWSFGYQRSMGKHPLWFSEQRPNSDTFSGGVSVPFGYWTFGLNGSWNEYRSEIQGNAARINTSGRSRSLEFDASRVIHRDQVSKTTVTGSLSWKSTESYILGSLVEVSSRNLSVANLGLSHSRQLLGGQLSVSGTYSRGLAILGAFDDASAAPGSPKGQFNKFSTNLSYVKPFELGQFAAVYNGSVSGQWSPDLMFGSEQMSLGGLSSVRGVRESLLSGNNAVTMRNELSLRFPDIPNAELAQVLGRFEPYVALDIGHVFEQADHGIAGGTLSGFAVGLRNSQGALNFDLSYSDLISAPAALTSVTDQAGVYYARMSLSF